MLITIDTEICFECGLKATEHHHIIPQVYGGVKTIPLCSSCHMKVHGIKSQRRIDNHVENTKRGLDKNRTWELLSGWIVIKKCLPKDKFEFRKSYENGFGNLFSVQKIYRIYERVNELENDFLISLFRENISEFSSVRSSNNEFKILNNDIFKSIIENIKNNNKKSGKPSNLNIEAKKKGAEKIKKDSLLNEINIKNSKFIIESKKRGLNFAQITREMNEKGFRTKEGKLMNPIQVQRLYEKFKDI